MRQLGRIAVLHVAVMLALTASAFAQTTQQRIDALVAAGKCGTVLQDMVCNRAWGIMVWNRPYEGDGVKDCYGYARQIWNAILFDGSVHSEDYSNYSYSRANYWLGIAGGIPVNTAPDPNWATISSLGGVGNLKRGDLCGTVQGHRWGMDVHYGLYAGYDGGHKCFQCGGGYNGAYYTPWYNFSYYYKPLHAALSASTPGDIVIDNNQGGFSCSSNWATGTSSVDKYGADYRYRSTGAISDTANWTFSVGTARNYEIYAWWAQGSNRANHPAYTLPDNTTVQVNQQVNGGRWNSLGTKSLSTGSNVVKLSCWTTSGFVVIADAVKLSPR